MGFIAHDLLIKRLKKAGYYVCQFTPSLWRHGWRSTDFTLVVNDFGIKSNYLQMAYSSQEDRSLCVAWEHLLRKRGPTTACPEDTTNLCTCQNFWVLPCPIILRLDMIDLDEAGTCVEMCDHRVSKAYISVRLCKPGLDRHSEK